LRAHGFERGEFDVEHLAGLIEMAHARESVTSAGHFQPCFSRGNFSQEHSVPQGSRIGGKNSPAFQCGGLMVLQTSPAGTTENGVCCVGSPAKTGFVSAIPAGLGVFPDLPLVFTGRETGIFLQWSDAVTMTGGINKI
jgi:hypothetical protein